MTAHIEPTSASNLTYNTVLTPNVQLLLLSATCLAFDKKLRGTPKAREGEAHSLKRSSIRTRFRHGTEVGIIRDFKITDAYGYSSSGKSNNMQEEMGNVRRWKF